MTSATELASPQTGAASGDFEECLSDSLIPPAIQPQAESVEGEGRSKPEEAMSGETGNDSSLLFVMIAAMSDVPPVTPTPLVNEAGIGEAASLGVTARGTGAIPQVTEGGTQETTAGAETGLVRREQPPKAAGTLIARGDRRPLGAMPPAISGARAVTNPSPVNSNPELAGTSEVRRVEGKPETIAGSARPTLQGSFRPGNVITPPTLPTDQSTVVDGGTAADSEGVELVTEESANTRILPQNVAVAPMHTTEARKNERTLAGRAESSSAPMGRRNSTAEPEPTNATATRVAAAPASAQATTMATVDTPVQHAVSEPTTPAPDPVTSRPVFMRSVQTAAAPEIPAPEARSVAPGVRPAEILRPGDRMIEHPGELELKTLNTADVRGAVARPRIERAANNASLNRRGVQAYEESAGIDRLPIGPVPGGTASAKLEDSMDIVAEAPQFAGMPEQKLPANGRSLPMNDPKSPGPAAIESLPGVTGEAVIRQGVGTSSFNVADRSLSSIEASPESRSAARTMENLVSSVTREVAQFKRYNAESMAVVLKPDAHTEIFLHLVSRNGSVEMQARFERGDFQALNGHWSQLQQSLSQNGVRLGALQEGFHPPSGNPSSANAQWGHGQLPGQQHQPGSRDGQEPVPAQSFHEEQPPAKPPSPTRPGAVVRRTTRRVALEAWA